MLPDPPIVNVDRITGYINFSSPYHEEIATDYYQVIIVDTTSQAMVNTTTDGHNISVGKLFQQPTCSPYIVIVQAHNTYGFEENNETVITNSTNSGGKL